MERTYGIESAFDEDNFERHILNDSLFNVKTGLMIAVTPETTLGEVVDKLATQKRRAVLVVESGRIVGIFGERDLLTRFALRDDNWRGDRVGDHMVPDPVSLPPESPLAYALNRMDLGDYRHIPVVNEYGHPVGLIAIHDIVAYLAHYVRHPD